MTTDLEPIPFALPDITEEEIDAVVEVLRSRWLTTGQRAHEFEQRFKERVGSPHAVAVNSCTAALHLALEAVGVGEGDLVYLPTYTFAATGEVVRYMGAIPVLIDVDPVTLNIDLEQLRATIKSDLAGTRGQPRAVIPVHFAGVPCEMTAIWDMAREFDLAVIEDAAHAFPAARDGITTGTMPSDVNGAVCFSFYATKTITTGEGGMLTTPHEAIAERARVMSLHGLSKQAWNRYSSGGSWRYDIVAPGFKYNLTDIAAALGCVQVQRADVMREARAFIAKRYAAAFAGSPLELPSVPAGVHSAWHLFPVRMHPECRDRFIQSLTGMGVATSVHFIPLHCHSFYRTEYHFTDTDFPVAAHQAHRVVSLPIWSAMSADEVDRVIDAVLLASTGSAS